MLNIPEDYEPYKLNCIAGDAVVGILCRRPDGGVSDWHAKMNRKAVNGICPISGKEMKEVRTGVFVRKTGDITVVMTNNHATRAHSGLTVKSAPKKRIMPKRKVSVQQTLPVFEAQVEEVDVDIDEVMRTSMKEAGL